MSRIALYLPTLRGGGMERVMLHLAEGILARGHEVEVVVSRAEGDNVDKLPQGIGLAVLEEGSALRARWLALRASSSSGVGALARPVLFAQKTGRQLRYLEALSRYLRERRPHGLIAAYPYCNLVAVWAKRLAGTPTRVLLTEHNTSSRKFAAKAAKGAQWRFIAPLVRAVYPLADAVVGVSDGVSEDLAATAGLPRSAIATIYNPVVTRGIALRAAEAPPHPWLAGGGGPPVVVGAGRLVAAKNFALLLRAFAALRAQRPARLLILGEGPERAQLEALARELGVREDVALPGFVANPYAAFSRAALFVLSSDFEGLPTVLIEALACGCPAVSTDCPSGPAEILARGRYGELVPVGDRDALARAMARALDAPLSPQELRQRGNEFNMERSAARYLDLLLPQQAGASATG